MGISNFDIYFFSSKERCTDKSCGENAFCFKRKYCRCKKGYGGDPKILCTGN